MRISNRLIVFEGIDGSGKATQVALLAKRLRAEGKRVSVFASPRYEKPTGKVVKQALLGAYGDFVALSPYLSALPYMLDFATSRDEIAAALKKGIVICDRYLPSTLAFHSAKLPRGKQKAFLSFVESLMYRDLKLPRPSVVIFLDMPVANAQKLIRGKKKDQHEKNIAYQKRVATAYQKLAKRKDWRAVLCTRNGNMLSAREIHERLWKALQ